MRMGRILWIFLLAPSLLWLEPAQADRRCGTAHVKGRAISEVVKNYNLLDGLARLHLKMRDDAIVGVDLLGTIARVASSQRLRSEMDWVPLRSIRKEAGYSYLESRTRETLGQLYLHRFVDSKDSEGRHWERFYRLTPQGAAALQKIIDGLAKD